MGTALFVGCGGFLGALSRHALAGLVHRIYPGPFPVGTLVVNVLGCLLIGFLMALLDRGPLVSTEMRSFLTIGLLGSFTTFSTFGYETWGAIRVGDARMAILNVLLNVLVGLAALWLGHVLGGC